MKNLIDWLNHHWQERGFKISTACGLIIIYMELFHRPELNALLVNPICVTAIIGWLVGTKKF